MLKIVGEAQGSKKNLDFDFEKREEREKELSLRGVGDRLKAGEEKGGGEVGELAQNWEDEDR